MRDLTAIPPIPATRRVKYGDDPNHCIDVFDSPITPRAVLMFIHGGFWRAKYDLAHASHLCAAVAQSGMTVANVEYRRVGNPGGGWPGTFEDLKFAVSAIREMFADQPVIVAGHSAGGHLALRLACEPLHLHGTLALAPVAVLREAFELHLSNDAVVEFLGSTPDERPRAYAEACPSQHSPTTPVCLIHGAEDETVPISLSRNYMALRNQDDVRLIKLPSTGHMELIDPESHAFTAVAAALNDLLR